MASANDYVSDEFYRRHLKGVTKFAANPVSDRYSILYRYHVKRITEMALNRFKWLNMPKTIDTRFLELNLFRSALAVFYYEYDLERFLALQGTMHGSLDMMGNPKAFKVIGNRFVSKTLPAEMCVPIWANYLRVPDHDLVLLWAHRIAETELSIEINVKNARRPRVLVYGENSRMSAQNVNDAINRGDPTIELAEDFANNVQVSSFDLGGNHELLEKLHILRMRFENQMMGELGINNANQDKKERLVASEVDANDEQTEVAKAVNLNARKFAAMQINDKYGLEIEVKYGSDVQPEVESTIAPNPRDDQPEEYPTKKEDD